MGGALALEAALKSGLELVFYLTKCKNVQEKISTDEKEMNDLAY